MVDRLGMTHKCLNEQISNPPLLGLTHMPEKKSSFIRFPDNRYIKDSRRN